MQYVVSIKQLVHPLHLLVECEQACLLQVWPTGVYGACSPRQFKPALQPAPMLLPD